MTNKVKGLMKMLLIGAVIMAVGIIIIGHTDSFLKIVMIAAGIGAIIDGAYTLIGAKKWKYTELTKTLPVRFGYKSAPNVCPHVEPSTPFLL